MYKNGNNCILYVFISRSTISNFTKNSSYTERTEKLSKSNIRRYLFNFYIFIKFTILQLYRDCRGENFYPSWINNVHFLTLSHSLSHKGANIEKDIGWKTILWKELRTNAYKLVRKKKERRKKKSNNVKLSRFNHDKLKRRLNHSSRRLTNWMFGLICPR